MAVDTQIVLSLIIILAIQTFIILFAVSKFNKSKDSSLKDGLTIGSKIPEISYENIDGNIKILNSETLKNIKYLVFLDPDCRQCAKLLNSFDVFNDRYLKDMKIILRKTEENKNSMKIKKYEDKSLFIEEETMFGELKINGFPFIFKINELGNIEKKGYISKNALVDYFL